MNKIKNKNIFLKLTVFGFTLIELLAVIVILAVILVIAVPAVVRIIKNSRIGAFNSDVKLIIKAIDLQLIKNPPLNPIAITNDNIQSILGIASDNYKYIEIYNEEDGNLRVIVEGKNKWGDFVACGNSNDLIVVDDISDCNVFPVKSVNTTAEISELITTGYIPIATPAELNNIRNSTANTFGAGTAWENTYTGGLDKNYIQVANIDLNIAPFNTGLGWEPIGSRVYNCIYANQTGTSFQGNYNGGGYKIRNLYINRPTNIYPVGLFSSSTGNFSNIILENADVTGGPSGTIDANPTAILVGQVAGNVVNIDNVKISGTVKTVGDDAGKVGSVVGQALAISKINITNSSTIGNITSVYGKAGGFIGQVFQYSEIFIDNSNFNGNVITGWNKVGGFIGEVGYNRYTVTAISSNKLTIKNSIAKGDVISNFNRAGGLIGVAGFVSDVLIENSQFVGNIKGSSLTAGQKFGGFIGEFEKGNSFTIRDSTVDANITGLFGPIGGFIGAIHKVQTVMLDNLEFSGKIDSSSTKWVRRIGGLIGAVGNNDPALLVSPTVDIKNCSVKADIIGGSIKVGGLVGSTDTTYYITDIYNLNIENSSYEGNIIIDNIFLPLNGKTSFYLMAGGLVGSTTNVTITNSFVKANIQANFDDPNCRRAPLVINNHTVGGLVGRVATSANITNSYYAGDIEIYHNTTLIDPNTYTYINTVVGSTDKTTMSGVYYDSDLINFEDPLAQPKTTLEMKSGTPSAQIYTGWNTDIWDFSSTSSYPVLKNN